MYNPIKDDCGNCDKCTERRIAGRSCFHRSLKLHTSSVSLLASGTNNVSSGLTLSILNMFDFGSS